MESNQNNLKNWFTPGRFALLLALAIIAAFPEVVTGIASFVYRDYGIFSYPNAFYWRECFWQGKIPLWNPLSNCGIPFLAQWNTQVLYPPALFYLIFPLEWSLPIFNLLHLFFGGFGMYLLLILLTKNRLGATVGAIAYCFSGIAINCVMWQSNIAALGWSPWFIASVYQLVVSEKPQIYKVIITGSMQLLAGSPEITVATYLITAAIVLPIIFSKKSKTIIALVIAAIGMAIITSIQLLPFLELVNESNRGGRFIGSVWNMPVYGWANFFVPLFHLYHSELGVFLQYYQCWTSSYYCGLFIILLSIFTVLRSNKIYIFILAILFLLGVALAIGKEGILYEPAIKILPALKMMRYPVKFVIVSVMAVPFLAAEGISLIFQKDTHCSLKEMKMFLIIVGIGIIVSGLILFDAFVYPLERDNWYETTYNAVERWLLCIGAIVVIYGLIKQLRPHWGLQFFLPVIIFVDLYTHNPIQNPTIEPWVYEPNITRQEWQKESSLQPLPQPGVSRVLLRPNDDKFFGHVYMRDLVSDYMASRLFLFCNCNLLENFPKADGFFPLEIKRYYDFYFLLRKKDGDLPENLLDLMSVSHINENGKFFHFQRRNTFLPFITAGQNPEFENPPEIFKKLLTLAPRRTVYLPTDCKGDVSAKFNDTVKLDNINFSPHKIRFQIACNEPTMVVISQAFYKNWRAYIDGIETKIYPANYAFTAIESPGGSHSIRLVYIDKPFVFGIALSTIGMLLISINIFLKFRKNKYNG